MEVRSTSIDGQPIFSSSVVGGVPGLRQGEAIDGKDQIQAKPKDETDGQRSRESAKVRDYTTSSERYKTVELPCAYSIIRSSRGRSKNERTGITSSVR